MPDARAESTHHVHPGDLPYSTPVLRSASPSGSLTTEYGPDATSPALAELSADAFESAMEDALGLKRPPILGLPPFFPSRVKGMDEKVLFERVMVSLRWHVQRVEDDERAEAAVVRNLQSAREVEVLAAGVDEIMQSMMGPPLSPMRVDDLYGGQNDLENRLFGGHEYGNGEGSGRAR